MRELRMARGTAGTKSASPHSHPGALASGQAGGGQGSDEPARADRRAGRLAGLARTSASTINGRPTTICERCRDQLIIRQPGRDETEACCLQMFTQGTMGGGTATAQGEDLRIAASQLRLTHGPRRAVHWRW